MPLYASANGAGVPIKVEMLEVARSMRRRSAPSREMQCPPKPQPATANQAAALSGRQMRMADRSSSARSVERVVVLVRRVDDLDEVVPACSVELHGHHIAPVEVSTVVSEHTPDAHEGKQPQLVARDAAHGDYIRCFDLDKVAKAAHLDAAVGNDDAARYRQRSQSQERQYEGQVPCREEASVVKASARCPERGHREEHRCGYVARAAVAAVCEFFIAVSLYRFRRSGIRHRPCPRVS